MKKIIPLALLVLFGFAIFKFFFSGSDEEVIDDEDEPITMVKRKSKGSGELSMNGTAGSGSKRKSLSKKKTKKIVEIEATDAEKEKAMQELETVVEDVSKYMEVCRKKLQEIVPTDLLDGETRAFKSAEGSMEVLGGFYGLMNEKQGKLNILEGALNNSLERGVDFKRFDQKMKEKSVRDCGDFEEHSLLSTLAEASSEYKWSKGEKKKIVDFVVDRMNSQISENTNFIQMAVKINGLQEFIEEGLLPESYEAGINEMLEDSRNAQEEIARMLPMDPNGKVTNTDLTDIRNRSKEAVELIALKFKEMATKLKEGE